MNSTKPQQHYMDEVNRLYNEFEVRMNSEQILLSDLSIKMHEDVIKYYNLNDFTTAECIVLGLSGWISKDVNYFLRMKDSNIKIYAWDVVSSLQLLGQLINICEDFKQWNTAYSLQREYSKLNIKYSLVQAA